MAKKDRALEVRLEQNKFRRQMHAFIVAAGKDETEILKSGMAAFAHFAAKNTTPDAGGSIKKTYVDKKGNTQRRYFRPITEIVSRRVTKTKAGKVRKKAKKLYFVVIKRKGRKAIIRYGTEAKIKKYQRITYRGIGRAGWFLNAPPVTGEPYTSAENTILRESPYIRTKKSINVIKLNKTTASLTNNSPEIASYAQIAMAYGYKAAAAKIKKQRLKFLHEQTAKFNG
jgi:hypothetical protein